MQYRDIGERLGTACNCDIDVAEHDLIGRIGDRLVCGCARPADTECLHTLGHERHERYFTRDVRSNDVRDNGAEDESFDFPAAEIGPLDQLGDTKLSKVDCRDRLESGAGFCEGSANTIDNRDASAVSKRWHPGKLTGWRYLSRMSRTFSALESDVFDVLVIGGGITGAGVARDAAMRGMSVALVEKNEWASGTSSRSSRLVHGGIRYLEHGDIALVRESVREREILLRIAPGLVKPLEFTWPVYRGARLPKWKLRAGLTLYDLLAGKRRVRAHRSLDVSEVLEKEPKLQRDGLTGGASYYDASTDDAGL